MTRTGDNDPKIVPADAASRTSMNYGPVRVHVTGVDNESNESSEPEGICFWIEQNSCEGGYRTDTIHLTVNQVEAVAHALLDLLKVHKDSTHKHVAFVGGVYKRVDTGFVYRVKDFATDSKRVKVVIYEDVTTGELHTRPRTEFEDGRFVRECNQ